MSYFPANVIVLTLWGALTVAVAAGTGAGFFASALVGVVLALVLALPLTYILGLVAGLILWWRERSPATRCPTRSIPRH